MKKKVFTLTPVALACKCVLAQTLPTGGAIVQGQGSIATGSDSVIVNQTSQRMIADWQSFSIGSGQTVQFAQPSADAVALNRVIGADPSRILGNLSANGRVYLQNPNGVLFAKGAQVNVGSLVATTLQADPKELMETGRLKLGGAGGSAGTVANEGTINVAQGGYAVLAGADVINTGTIDAPGGAIALAAAGDVTVDPTGAGVVSISVSAEAVGARLVNSGTLAADGGRISLQVAAADAAASRVLQVDGVVRARSIEEHDGEIVLSGGTSGVVSVGGQLDVSGDGANGGSVQVLGDRILLQGASQIDASGTNGGSVLVGGAFQGQGSVPAASVTVVDQGARIDTSARHRGNGGDVVVWANDFTSYSGSIAARGGAAGGDGGNVEVSGKDLLQFRGTVDTQAPAGKQGTLLLDPNTLNLVSDTYLDPDAQQIDSLTGDELVGWTLLESDYSYSSSAIKSSYVAELLATNDVTLQANYYITVMAPLSVAAGGADSTLTLNATHVDVNAPMTLNNTALIADTARLSCDAIRINAPVTSRRSVALISTSIHLAADVIVPSLTLTSPNDFYGQIVQTEGSIHSDFVVARTPGGPVELPQAGNTIGRLDVTAHDARVTVGFTPDGSPLRTNATIGENYSLTVGGSVVQLRSLAIGGELDLTTGGDATFDDPNNELIGPVRFDVGGSLRLRDVNDLTASGTAFNDIHITAQGLLTLGADIGSTNAGRPSLVELSSAGFDNGAGAHVNVQPGSRFIIRSSDFEKDVIGAIGFSADDIANVNYTVLDGWVGADPTSGNGYYTNRRGRIEAPNADRPPISRVYDRTTGFDYTQTGPQADALLENDPGTAGLSYYIVGTHGAFDDPNAGTHKRYTVAGTHNVVATYADNGSAVYGLRYESFTRPAGEVGAAGPGNAISEIVPRPVYSDGVDGVDRAHDGTNQVVLDISDVIFTGVLTGDAVGLVAGNLVGTVADPDAGIDKPVTSDGALVLDGPDAHNYVLIDQSTPTVTITDIPPPVVETPPLAEEPPPPVVESPPPVVEAPVPELPPAVDVPPSPAAAPQKLYRTAMIDLRVVPPAEVDLRAGPLALPTSPLVAVTEPCNPQTEQVTDARTHYFYFPYRSSTIDEARSASEQNALMQALAEGFEVQRVRGFTSPEGLRNARYGFEGNDELSYRRALAALVHLRELCAEHGERCVPDSVQAEAGSELHTLMQTDAQGESREVEGIQLAEYVIAEFSSSSSDASQRTQEIERELHEARTPVEKAQVVYPQLRRVEIELTRQREVERSRVASTAACSVNHSIAFSTEPAAR